jgi:hypothetical protein
MNLDTCEIYISMATPKVSDIDRGVAREIVKECFENIRQDPEMAFFSLVLMLVDPDFEAYRIMIATLVGAALSKASELPNAQQSIGRIYAKFGKEGIK